MEDLIASALKEGSMFAVVVLLVWRLDVRLADLTERLDRVLQALNDPPASK